MTSHDMMIYRYILKAVEESDQKGVKGKRRLKKKPTRTTNKPAKASKKLTPRGKSSGDSKGMVFLQLYTYMHIYVGIVVLFTCLLVLHYNYTNINNYYYYCIYC